MAGEGVKIGDLRMKVPMKPGDRDEGSGSKRGNDAHADTADKMKNEIGSNANEVDDIFTEMSDMLSMEGSVGEMFFSLMSIMDLCRSRLVVKRYTKDVAGVKACIVDNGLNSKDNKDVVYAMIIVNLVQLGAITISDDTVPTDPAGMDCGLLDPSQIHTREDAAKRIVVLMIHRMAKGNGAAEAKCYRHFCIAHGDIISKSRFGDLRQRMVNSEGLIAFAKALTIGEILAEDEDLQHFLIWDPTPELVIRAFNSASTPLKWVIRRYVNAKAFEDYARFHKGGVAALVAAGPLKVFCKGEVDPLKDFVSDDTRVCDLAPIHNPPYDGQTIRQAKIIMDAYGIEYRGRFQGMKASKGGDNVFRMVVNRVRSLEKEVAAKKDKA